ncbi:MAG: hypothetical protein A3A86_06790 [Elusimicrobia bacterium RIFCSPLOWO2_01_FULL_60_11]|nr:MAG: hypothetical protein A3A86_06790 [Elusimicrobia bacterium RIFCSPLOWO2_01_FULL_60_11]
MFENKDIRIVVADDDAEVLKTLAKILKRRGYEVFPFDSPHKALDFLRQEKVDLILSDLKMPDMDGIQFLDKAKKIHPKTPFILITGYATVDTAVSAIKWGAFDYLRKPFEVKKIYEVIDKALR